MSSEPAIRVDNLGKCYQVYDKPRDRLLQAFAGDRKRFYREFWALRGVGFEVARGEAVGVIGRNGSGKSTLLQIVTGTSAPTEGTVGTHGCIAALLELGSGFNPEFTGRENVFLNGLLLGLTRDEIERRFDAIAAFADIGAHLDQPVKTYSSGMVLRLAFAVQVQVEPDILIVDEALAVGDALFQKRCFQRIDRLVSQGTTLLFVSHEQETIRTLTQRALLLEEGRMVSWGVSSTVVLDYRRLLHREEAAYFEAAANDVRARAAKGRLVPGTEPWAPASAGVTTNLGAPASAGVANSALPSAPSSFGDGEVAIVGVETLDAQDVPCSVFYPGDLVRLRVTCEARAAMTHLSVAVRLRNKEGVKMYSWGTLNQDMATMAAGGTAPLFWNRTVAAGERFAVTLACRCRLGVNLYEVQAAVSLEETPDYQSQRMLHWLDEAAFFQVLMKNDEYFFGGVADLEMEATW